MSTSTMPQKSNDLSASYLIKRSVHEIKILSFFSVWHDELARPL
jgi:hypothetical protein